MVSERLKYGINFLKIPKKHKNNKPIIIGFQTYSVVSRTRSVSTVVYSQRGMVPAVLPIFVFDANCVLQNNQE